MTRDELEQKLFAAFDDFAATNIYGDGKSPVPHAWLRQVWVGAIERACDELFAPKPSLTKEAVLALKRVQGYGKGQTVRYEDIGPWNAALDVVAALIDGQPILCLHGGHSHCESGKCTFCKRGNPCPGPYALSELKEMT